MPTSQGTLTPFVTISRSAQVYNTVAYPVGGNVSTTTSANFKAAFQVNTNVIYVTYVTNGVIVPGMSITGIGIPAGAVILGPLNQNGTGTGGLGSYTISMLTTGASVNFAVPTGTLVAPFTGSYGLLATAGNTLNGQATQQSTPQGPGGVVGPVPGFNCVNIQDLRDYYNLPYPPSTPLASPPVIAIVSFGGGVYGQPVTTGKYAGFWKCTDISGNNGAPIQVLVSPINGAINAPNSDDGGATLENTIDIATVNAFYGMIDPRRDAPIYTPPIIILYIAPSSDISEMYRTFYTVLKNPVVCNGQSYLPSIVTCSWGAPEIAWTQKMAFPPNQNIPVDNSPNPVGIAELNEINDLFAEATKNGINICCAAGDIPLNTVNASVNTFSYAQQLLLQGLNGPGTSGQIAVSQPTVFPLTDPSRASLPAPQVMFPASSPYVTCVGGSALYFPSINSGSYANPAEFAWIRGNGGISSAFSIPSYQQQLPGSAATSAAQFLASSLNTSNLSQVALGTPVPLYNTISGGYTAPNTAVVLATQTKEDAYTATLSAFNAANAALQAAQLSDSNDALMNSLVETVKDASTALATATEAKRLANVAKDAAEDLVVKTQTVSSLLVNAGTVFGAAQASTLAATNTQSAVLAAQLSVQTRAYNQLVTPTTQNAMLLQNANQALQAAQSAANASALAAVTLPKAVLDTTELANKAVAQAASAVIAPSLSTHPYLESVPITSSLVPASNKAYNTAVVAAGDLPYDPSATVAPSYLLTAVGLGYTTDYADASGNNYNSATGVTGNNNIRQHLQDSVTASDLLVFQLVNSASFHPTGATASALPTNGSIGEVASLTDRTIAEAYGQLAMTGVANSQAIPALQSAADSAVTAWGARASSAFNSTNTSSNPNSANGFAEALPDIATPYTAAQFTARAKVIAKSGAALISSYQSGAGNANTDGFKLPCGLASAAASALAAVWPVTNDERAADKAAGFPYPGLAANGQAGQDVMGGVDASGTYTGITAGLINLRNIYANTTLASRRATTATNAAHEAKDAFLAWHAANDEVNELQSQATTLYNLVPPPSNEQVRVMDKKLLDAKTALSEATYALGVADNYAVTTARLAHQSAVSMSVLVGNRIDVSGTGADATFDELGNLKAVANTNSGVNGAPTNVAAQGGNNANCPAIKEIVNNGTVSAKEALVAAQAMALAAANDNYLTTSITTWNTHGVTGVDTSGNQTASLTGTRLLVQDAQFAAAGAAGQVANVAFADATEALARFTDWNNVALIAQQANTATNKVYIALADASGNGAAQPELNDAVDAISATVTLIIAASTPYNQQSTPSATIATNNVVALASKLENALNVCTAAQAAIQLAASTYNQSESSNISGSGPNGGSIFTVNMAYAKVTADAAQAACTAAAILAREQAVLAARRANYSAIALRNLVGEGIIGGAIAGFLNASGNLVAQTGYGQTAPSPATNQSPAANTYPLPYTASPAPSTTNALGVNGYIPPAVQAKTVLYQGAGGLDYEDTANSLGALQEVSNRQPTIQTNLTYTAPAYTNVYSAVAALTVKTQAVIAALQADSSGNTTSLASPNQYLTYPNVNSSNALNTAIAGSGGSARTSMNEALLAAYEAQQWVVASANASFVTFGYSAANVNLVSFTPTLLGVVNKLANDADDCLQTVLNAQGAILYALSKRPNPVALHDLDASNFAAVFNSNQAAADTYLALRKACIKNEQHTLIAFHQADLANAFSPLSATAATAAGQAAALGAMSWSSPAVNPNFLSNAALANANFPAQGWGSASPPGVVSNLAGQNAVSTNPNYGPYNGTALGAAPFPAQNSSTSSRIQAPASSVLAESAQLLQGVFSDAALAAAKAAADASQTSSDFNALMVDVSTVTPSLVDTATRAAQDTLLAAQSANFATSLNNQGLIQSDLTNFAAILLQKQVATVLAAAQSARANLEAIAPEDARYISRQNTLNLWNKAVDIASEALQASANGPSNFQYITVKQPNGTEKVYLDPRSIINASLGNLTVMGTATSTYNSNGNTAKYALPADDRVIYGDSIDADPESDLQPSLLSLLNVAIRDAYNATTGAPQAPFNPTAYNPVTGQAIGTTYGYISFEWPYGSGTRVTNMPENTNDTNQAYNNAVAALNASYTLGNSKLSSVITAAVAIKAAYDAAVAVQNQTAAVSQPTLDASGNSFTGTSAQAKGWAQATSNFGAGNTSVAVAFWNCALEFVNSLLNTPVNITKANLSKLMSIVGVNFNVIEPADQTALSISLANAANLMQQNIINYFQTGNRAGVSPYVNLFDVDPAGLGEWPGYVNASGTQIKVGNGDAVIQVGQANGAYLNSSGNSVMWSSPISGGNSDTSGGWSAYYYTVAIMGSGNLAFTTAYKAWNAVLAAYNAVVADSSTTILDTNAGRANDAKMKAVYSVKLALQSAARAGAAGEVSARASAALASATDSYEDLAAEAAAEAAYASTGNLNMYRCVPDIAMHADADDLPVIFRLNGGNVYVGGTAVAASMFAGFLGVVQSHSPINYFVNPVLYDNYTFPSPLFNDISGSQEVWYPGALGGSVIPPRIRNVLPGLQNPTSGLGSGLYNCHTGLGSIKGMNLAALMAVPHLVTAVNPDNSDSASVTVYPGTSATITAYVEPVTAYNPHLTWSISSPNAFVSQTNGPNLSNNGSNDTQPYTGYDPLQRNTAGLQIAPPTPSVGNYDLGSIGNIALGKNPYNKSVAYPDGAPCLVFNATVTGVAAVPASSPLPVITVSSTDGSSVYGQFNVVVLPAIQVTGVSISALNEYENPANTTLFLGTTQQLVANVTPLTATNKRVYWWSSNTAVVNVDASGLLTSLAPGQVTIKATSVNNNISASISVYVPTPITGLSVLPTTITLNPNMGATPLKNLGVIRAIVQPAEADYKHLSWEVVSSQQAHPSPAGITDVVSLPMNGTVLARDSSGDITDNTEATVTALSNGTAVLKVSTYGEPYGVYGTYTSMVTVNVVTPVTDVVMGQADMVINLNPHTAQYDSPRSLPESYKVTATLKPAYPSNMNVFWSSSNPKVAVVSNNSAPVLNTTVSDPNFGLWQITETITPLSNGTTVIKVTTADGSKTDTTTVVVTTPVTGLSMSAMPIVLNPTKLYTLQATVLPTTATNRSLIWESTNTAVATVDSNGIVKAVTTGSCGISATTVDGDYSAMAAVNVITPLVGVQLLVNTPLPIHINDVVQILVVMVPTTASNQQFSWTVTDGIEGNIFTTGPPQNGNIVYLDAVQAGNSVFTVTTADGNKQASINLSVVQW
uniref:BIG2 domain-containing protein n=1 Tax=viral metagenome TaxID=1070528 RepID=A0A6C0DMJ9_9ZZZZ